MTWAAVAICLLVSFVFSGIEAGLLSVNRVRLRHRVKQRDRAALILNRLIAQPERLLVTVLIVTNLMNIFALTLTTQELVRHFGPAGYWITLLAALPVYLMGLELLPKSLFRRFPYRALAFLATPLRAADLLLSPLHFAGGGLMRTLFRKRPAEQQKLFVAREDFKYFTIESERTGTLSSTERELIHNVVDFRAITARDVMLPLEKVRTIPEQASIETLVVAWQTGHIERWPVVDASGAIVGLVQIFDLALEGRPGGTVAPYQRRIVKVPAQEPAYSLLTKMRAARTTVAAVIDEQGRSLGIVTWEDLIQRLVATASP